MITRGFSAPVALSCFLMGGAASAQSTDQMGLRSDQPIDVSAERCEAYEKEDKLICTGSVRVSQEGALMTADKMTILGATSADGFTRLEGEGHFRYASGINAVSGDSAVYDGPNTTITVTGNVVAVQGDQVMVGGQLIYNTETRALQVHPGPDGRVRGLFHTASTQSE